MKKSFMNNIKHFVDSNVRQRIDRATNNNLNNDIFGDDLLLVERQFEDIRQVCVEAEKRISALLQSLSSSPLGTYTQNVQASLNNLSGLTTTPNSAAPIANSLINHPVAVHQLQTNEQSNSLSCTTFNTRSSKSQQQQTNVIVEPSSVLVNDTSSQQQSKISNDTPELRNDIRRHKKLPIVGFFKFLAKSCHKLKSDSLLGVTLTHCSQLQAQLTKLYLEYEQAIGAQCLKPIQHILEVDAPNVIKLRKLFIKSHNDLESIRAKYNVASQKQQQLQTSHFTSTSYTVTQSNAQQSNVNKLDQLKKEMDDALTRFEQSRDTYATELYAFICREAELVNLFMKFYQHQAEYQHQVSNAIQNSLPSLNGILANTPRKVVFGTPLEEHLRCTGRSVSLVIELCIHLLYSHALNEEGLFRIPGSSVKIKKLKNAINAWFITLASQSDLEHDQQQQQSFSCTQTSIIAICSLFKGIVGQQPQQSTPLGCDIVGNQSTTTTSREDSTLTQTNSSAIPDSQQLVFDVHTIAGLLKLYLRELPEPLFTYALYDQWIEATVKTVNREQPFALERLIGQLPKSNYHNLKHLIRFLHLLTCHRDLNKMTASNLAITMAPSLIWAKPAASQVLAESSGCSDQQHDDIQALNIQMSSVGMSASLHALVIENLISNAEKIFPGPVHFAIPKLDDAPCTSSERNRQPKHYRCIKSTSPTGLSTASSSSFSSASNTSVASSMSKSHSRKGGSMEGLLGTGITLETSSRPMSTHLQREQQPQCQQPPPIPPAPMARSHLRQGSDSFCSTRVAAIRSSQVPSIPSNSIKWQTVKTDSSIDQSDDIQRARATTSNAQSADCSVTNVRSLRGTGTVPLNGHLNARPTVPPPLRPPSKPSSVSGDQVDVALSQIKVKSEESDDKSFNSFLSSGNLRTDFEEINGVDVDDADISVSVSPVVSLDSISGDSSFDNDCHSLEQSWTECDLDQSQAGKSTADSTQQVVTDKLSSNLSPVTVDPVAGGQNPPVGKEENGNEGGSASPRPVKPPRSISPKITQSTPL